MVVWKYLNGRVNVFKDEAEAKKAGATDTITHGTARVIHHSEQYYKYDKPVRQVNSRQTIPVVKHRIKNNETPTTTATITNSENDYRSLSQSKYHNKIAQDVQRQFHEHPISGSIYAIKSAIAEKDIATMQNIHDQAQQEKTQRIENQAKRNLNTYKAKLQQAQDIYTQQTLQPKAQSLFNKYIHQGYNENQARTRALKELKQTPEWQTSNKILNSLFNSKAKAETKKANKDIGLSDKEFKSYLNEHPRLKKYYTHAKYTKAGKDIAVTGGISYATGTALGGVVGGVGLGGEYLAESSIGKTLAGRTLLKTGAIAGKTLMGTTAVVSGVDIGWNYGKRLSTDIKKHDYFSGVSDTLETGMGVGSGIAGFKTGLRYTQQAKFKPATSELNGRLNSNIHLTNKQTYKINTNAQNIEFDKLPVTNKITMRHTEVLGSGEKIDVTTVDYGNKMNVIRKVGDIKEIRVITSDSNNYRFMKFKNNKLIADTIKPYNPKFSIVPNELMSYKRTNFKIDNKNLKFASVTNQNNLYNINQRWGYDYDVKGSADFSTRLKSLTKFKHSDYGLFKSETVSKNNKLLYSESRVLDLDTIQPKIKIKSNPKPFERISTELTNSKEINNDLFKHTKITYSMQKNYEPETFVQVNRKTEGWIAVTKRNRFLDVWSKLAKNKRAELLYDTELKTSAKDYEISIPKGLVEKPSLRIDVNPDLATSTIPSFSLGLSHHHKLKTEQKKIHLGMQFPSLKLNLKQNLNTNLKINSKIDTKLQTSLTTTQLTKNKLRLKTKQKLITEPNPNINFNPNINIDFKPNFKPAGGGFVGLGIPKMNIGLFGSRRAIKSKNFNINKYTPSFNSLVLGIKKTGSAKQFNNKVFTGFETRPILINKKHKKQTRWL